jgi:foldase protein PrsA
MAKLTRPILAFLTVSLAVAGLAACGGGTSSSDTSSAGIPGGGTSSEVVVQAGGSSITKAEINHWMSTLVGGDFYELAHKHTVPAGLVSEPPNYAACVARLEAVVRSSYKGPSKPTAAQLLSKCRQLHQGLKQQALNYLVQAQWLIDLAGEQGIQATNGEVMKLFNEVKARQFPKKGEFQQYLASNRRSLADELFVMKLDVLQRKIKQKVDTGGERMLALFTEAGQRVTAKTSCHAGYVVQHCKQYTGQPASPPSLPSPAVLLEQVAVLTGIPCINHPACG